MRELERSDRSGNRPFELANCSREETCSPWCHCILFNDDRCGELYGQQKAMNQNEHIKEILATYEKHGWRLRRVLLLPETRAELTDESWTQDAPIETADLDAMWFSRASQQNREAWELRLIAANQYALFETFEADEPEPAREELRREMENRMRDKVQ